jgi:hypothetical protein
MQWTTETGQPSRGRLLRQIVYRGRLLRQIVDVDVFCCDNPADRFQNYGSSRLDAKIVSFANIGAWVRIKHVFMWTEQNSQCD